MASVMRMPFSNLFKKFSPCDFPDSISNTFSPLITSVRYGRKLPWTQGLKRNRRARVYTGNPLCIQHRVWFHPGLNVGSVKLHTVRQLLYALTGGRVFITCEKMEPNWNHPTVIKEYSDRKGHPIYKKYIHVVPDPQHQRFKLASHV